MASLLSNVLLTGIFDKHLSVTDTSHIMGMIYLHKYW